MNKRRRGETVRLDDLYIEGDSAAEGVGLGEMRELYIGAENGASGGTGDAASDDALNTADNAAAYANTAAADDSFIGGSDGGFEGGDDFVGEAGLTERLDTVGLTEPLTEEILPQTAKKPDESSPRYLSRLVITLTAICAAVAVLLSAVNIITRGRIAESAAREKRDAVLAIFPAGTDSELYALEGSESEVYLVLRDGNVIGYCAFVTSSGFGGEMQLMVGINADGVTEGVRIVSMSETPGVGTKTNTDAFLSRFIGKGHTDPTGGVDAISGATVSSNAVKAGVEAAHALRLDLAEICAERGCELITPDRLAEIIAATEKSDTPATGAESGAESGTEVSTDTAAEGSEAVESEPISPDTEPDSSEPAESTDDPFVNNPGGRDYLYNIDVSAGSDRFVIEIPKDEETATFTKATEAPKSEPAATEPPKTEAPRTEPVTAAPKETLAPAATTTARTEPVTTANENTIPAWLDTEPEETIPAWLDTEPEETMPSWLG